MGDYIKIELEEDGTLHIDSKEIGAVFKKASDWSLRIDLPVVGEYGDDDEDEEVPFFTPSPVTVVSITFVIGPEDETKST